MYLDFAAAVTITSVTFERNYSPEVSDMVGAAFPLIAIDNSMFIKIDKCNFNNNIFGYGVLYVTFNNDYMHPDQYLTSDIHLHVVGSTFTQNIITNSGANSDWSAIVTVKGLYPINIVFENDGATRTVFT